MDVQVRHCLAGGSAVIDADVVPVGMEFGGQRDLGLCEEAKQGIVLISCCIKERTEMPLRDDQAMTRGDRKAIPDQERIFVLDLDSGLVDAAKRAR